MIYYLIYCISLMVLFLSSDSVQNMLLQDIPLKYTKLNFRILHPSLDTNTDFSIFSGVYELKANITLTPNLNMIATVPVVNYSPSEREGESGIGNLFIAIQPIVQRDSTKLSAATIGVAVPTANQDNRYGSFYGLMTNFHANYKYLPDMLTIITNIANYHISQSGSYFGYEIGPRLAIPTGDSGDTEFMLHYGLIGGIKAGDFIIPVELAGLIFLSNEAESFSDRMFHTFAFGIRYAGGVVQPGIYYKIYLKEELSRSVSGVLGVSVALLVK